MRLLSHVRLVVTPWTVVYQASPSTGFSRQEYWSGLPFPSPGDLPDPGIEPGSPALEADALTSEPPGKPQEFDIWLSVYLCNKVVFCLVTKSYLTLCDPWSMAPRLLFPWDFPDKNVGVGCHFLLQGIFPTQGLNPWLLNWHVDSLALSHLGSPCNKVQVGYLSYLFVYLFIECMMSWPLGGKKIYDRY